MCLQSQYFRGGGRSIRCSQLCGEFESNLCYTRFLSQKNKTNKQKTKQPKQQQNLLTFMLVIKTKKKDGVEETM